MTSGGNHKPRVLVLDNGVYQKLFDTILGNGYELLATDQPQEAVSIANSQSPDLILLSYSIAGSDGIMVAKEIRKLSPSGAPILLMLNSDRPTLRREGKAAGCNEFLVKPIDPEKLRNQIESLLGAKPE